MSHFSTEDDSVHPFDQRPPEPPNSAYRKTKCGICGGKALYRVGARVFCRDHKSIAVALTEKGERA